MPAIQPPNDPNNSVAASYVRNAAQKRKAAVAAKAKAKAAKPAAKSLKQTYGINPDNANAFAGPMTLRQALGAANAAAGLKYGAQLGTLNTQIQETPQWYKDYKTSVEGARVAAQKYQQGLIDQSNNIATQVGQTVLGSMEDQQAAQSRKALANAGTNLIAGMGAANDTYFGDRKGVADASKIATMTNLLTQKRQVQGEKANYRTSTLNDLRTNATNADIARDTLNANVSNDKTNAAIDVAKITQTAKDAAKKRTADRRKARAQRRIQVRGQNVTIRGQDVSATNTANRIAATKQKEAAKKHETIQKATGKIDVKVHDIITDWAGGANVAIRDPKTGQKTGKTRPATRNELRGAMDGKHGRAWVEIALKVRDGKPLTHTEIAYLHAQDPNIRVPKAWLKGRAQAPKPKTVPKVHNAPDGSGGSRPT